MSCEPIVPLKVENQTKIVLAIYVENHKAGEVKPNEIIKIKDVPMTLTHYRIEAINKKGEIIYSKKFSWDELHDLDWKVVITHQNN